MTFAELERLLESKKRVEREKAQEKAASDYILADLIGKSVSRIYSSSNNLPDIVDVYPTLFNTKEIEEKRQEKRQELSALRFKQFAQSFNNRFKQEEAKDN